MINLVTIETGCFHLIFNNGNSKNDIDTKIIFYLKRRQIIQVSTIQVRRDKHLSYCPWWRQECHLRISWRHLSFVPFTINVIYERCEWWIEHQTEKGSSPNPLKTNTIKMNKLSLSKCSIGFIMIKQCVFFLSDWEFTSIL